MKTDNGKEFPTLASEWQRYRYQVYGDKIKGVQAIETQQAFMAGAWLMFELVSAASGAWKNEETAAKALEQLRTEAEGYHEKRLKEMEARN